MYHGVTEPETKCYFTLTFSKLYTVAATARYGALAGAPISCYLYTSALSYVGVVLYSNGVQAHSDTAYGLAIFALGA